MRHRARVGWALLALAAAIGRLRAAPPQAAARPPAATQRLERHFLQQAAANLRLRSEASRLASDRSENPAVRDLAERLLQWQDEVLPELLRLLDARAMAMPMRLSAHNKLLRRLARLRGAAFDRVYLDEVVLPACQADAASYEVAAAQAADPVLKAWARRQLPELRGQIAQAEQVQSAGMPRGGTV